MRNTNGTIIRLEDMRLFATVARAGGFSAAGRLLDMPKQTVSRRIAALEQALGVTLLHRTTRSLQLTQVGQTYAKQCEQIAAIAEEANRQVRDAVAEPRGCLRVSCDQIVGEFLLADLAAVYLGAFPEVSLTARVTREKIDLREAGVDLAIRVGRMAVEAPDLTVRKLGPAAIQFLAAPHYLAQRGEPQTPQALAEHDCIVPGDSARWPFAGPDGPFYQEVTGRFQVNDSHTAYRAALAGLGICVAPAFVCEADLAAGKLKALLTSWHDAPADLYLVYAEGANPPARLRAFIDLVVRRYRDLVPWERKPTKKEG
ncbi:LysR family transcriptional regulator [Acanthopleuribacter pedis]|uniref:LysR family transcriptional regulator n=1 Tax=Acanthopleuribacter pedis TaxID=442870 RepID=A0A8J7U5Z9_9BACT|nr:LysR family transcriptional regulator [Acanthopleuribacter pedis]MBO1321374.1 LysR family transcriptional regulator [Acanthopleuribacter pedis]